MKYIFKYLVLLFTCNFIEGSFRCDYRYSKLAKAWFKHFVIPATWFDAQLRCTLEGATLASPTTPNITFEMTHIIKSFYAAKSEIFTGISASVSQGDFFTFEGTRLSEYTRAWAYNEPRNEGNDENCIVINGDGELLDKPCNVTRPYICYCPEDSEMKGNVCGTVDPGYYFDTRTKSCYKFHDVARNFSRAYFTCSAEGGHLAIINSETEAQVLMELMDKYPADKMVGNFSKTGGFVGFHALDEEWDWRTVHGQTLWEAGYSKFSAAEPNNLPPGQKCGAIYRTGLLNDYWCERPYPFICEKNTQFPAVCEAADPDI